MGSAPRTYRLTDARGEHHAVIDDLFDSLWAADEAAQAWCEQMGLLPAGADPGLAQAVVAQHFGLEVSTGNGAWRTLRHAGVARYQTAMPS